jgi:hypothetical protein
LDAESIQGLVEKLKSAESMTWQEHVSSGRSHNVETHKLCDGARRRLRDIELDDLEGLFSLRLTGKERIWGIRTGGVLRVMWWDPEHQVCPSLKR